MKLSKDKLLIFSFVALIVLGWIISFTQNNINPSKAAGNPVSITMTTPQTTVAVNQEAIVTVTLSTGDSTKKISGLDMTFNTTGNLAITDSTAPVAVGGATLNVNEFAKTITGNQEHIAYAFLNTDAELVSSVTFQIKVKGSANGTGTLTLNIPSSQVVGTIAANTYDMPATVTPVSFTIGTTTTGAPTATPVPGTPTIKVRMNPASGSQALNGTFTVSLLIDGQQTGQKVSAFDVRLNINPSVLRINSVGEAQDETGSTSKFTKLTNTFNAATGDIVLNYISIQAEAALPVSVKVDISLTGIANGTGTVAINSAQVTGNITQNAFTTLLGSGQYTIGTAVTGNPTPTTPVTGNPTPTPTVIITGNPSVTPPTGRTVLNLKLKLQGITRQPAAQYNSMKVQVMVGKDGFMSAPQTGTFTADVGGVWSGTVAFNDVPAGSGYRVYVKPGKHLQKKLCDAAPTETAAGTYRCADGKISIIDGQNTFDFSKVYAMTGDLPDQNGVVDSYDTSYIKLNLGSTTANVLQIADLNLDGIVDTQDYALVIASLSIKYDDL